jgi:lipid-A-disaccharide synthase
LRYEPADLFFAAGEASGDLQASLLLEAMRRRMPHLTAGAIGGPRLRAAGARMLWDSTEYASIGPLSLLPNIPKLYFLLRGLVRAMRKQPSRLYIPVDAGAANLRIVSWLREGGYREPILYYFPPGAWLDDLKQAQKVARMTTPLTPFTHQRDFYARSGLQVAWFGNPLVSVIAQRAAQPDASTPTIAVLPGSRREEVERHLEVLARCAQALCKSVAVSFCCAAATEARAAQIAALWRKSGGPEPLSVSRTGVVETVRQATLAWTSSGTATLEAALAGVPQIAFYRVSPAQYEIAKKRLPPHLLENVALPNLVLERAAVPELLQGRFTVENLAALTLDLLQNASARDAQLAAYAEMRAKLGPPDALERIAAYALDQLEGRAAS